MKKLIALLLAAVMVLSLAACGQPAQPTTATETPTTQPAETQPAETTEPAAAGYTEAPYITALVHPPRLPGSNPSPFSPGGGKAWCSSSCTCFTF